MTEICFSEYFSGWETIAKWQKDFLEKFNKMANGESVSQETKLTVKTLFVGQRLVHSTYGIGSIVDIKKKDKTLVEVLFDSGKKLSFQMEIALKFFSRADVPTAEEITCTNYTVIFNLDCACGLQCFQPICCERCTGACNNTTI